jgi:hypothetical protein
MARTAEHLQEPDLLRAYLRNLARAEGPHLQNLGPRGQRPTSPNCGVPAVLRHAAGGASVPRASFGADA